MIGKGFFQIRIRAQIVGKSLEDALLGPGLVQPDIIGSNRVGEHIGKLFGRGPYLCFLLPVVPGNLNRFDRDVEFLGQIIVNVYHPLLSEHQSPSGCPILQH